jgi:predicted DNA-binding protein (MmcQ/YjbR family)
MEFEAFRKYCLSKAGASEEQPLGNNSFYYKVKDLVFAIADVDEYRLTLKCEPAKAIALRLENGYIKPGYHINKEHWNTFIMNEVEGELAMEPHVDVAYELVIQKLSKKQKAALGIEG